MPEVVQPQPNDGRGRRGEGPNVGQQPGNNRGPQVGGRGPDQNQNVQGERRRGGERGNPGGRGSGIPGRDVVRRDLGGNNVRIGNRNIAIASTNYQPGFNRHNWYGGTWNGNWGAGRGWGPASAWGYYGPGYGWGWGGGYGYGYGWRPLGWGLGAWGLGSLIYGSGYLPYYNPYYANVGVGNAGYAAVYDYAQPIPVQYDTPRTDLSSTGDVSNAAIQAFRRNDYDTALDLINRAVAQSPDDSALHEMRALVLFAKGDYRQAAATIHSVLALGPGWDWSTLSSLYPDVAIYTTQLRALEQFVGQNPRDAAGRFLSAYHYLTAGHADAAADQLQKVVAIVPEDHVAADLLRMLKPQSAETGVAERPTPQPPGPTTPPETVVNANSIIGTWQAAREDGAKFDLTLAPDKSFVWKYQSMNQPAQEMRGTYTLEGNVLALSRQDGGSLVGEITPEGQGFKFKLVGAPPEDKGLEFRG